MTSSERYWSELVEVSRTESKILLKCLVLVAASDRELHDKEVDILQVIFRKIVGHEISKIKIQEAYEDVLSRRHSIRDHLSMACKDVDAEVKDLIIKSCYLMMICDGKVVDHETEELAEIAALLRVDDDRFVQLIRESTRSS